MYMVSFRSHSYWKRAYSAKTVILSRIDKLLGFRDGLCDTAYDNRGLNSSCTLSFSSMQFGRIQCTLMPW